MRASKSQQARSLPTTFMHASTRARRQVVHRAGQRELKVSSPPRRFFVRFNRVLLDQSAIARERQRLQQHNDQLRTRRVPPT
jgi:hypothetical protein